MKIFEVKPRINKSNNQINFSLPRKELSSRQLNDIYSRKKISMMLIDRRLK